MIHESLGRIQNTEAIHIQVSHPSLQQSELQGGSDCQTREIMTQCLAFQKDLVEADSSSMCMRGIPKRNFLSQSIQHAETLSQG